MRLIKKISVYQINKKYCRSFLSAAGKDHKAICAGCAAVKIIRAAELPRSAFAFRVLKKCHHRGKRFPQGGERFPLV